MSIMMNVVETFKEIREGLKYNGPRADTAAILTLAEAIQGKQSKVSRHSK